MNELTDKEKKVVEGIANQNLARKQRIATASFAGAALLVVVLLTAGFAKGRSLDPHVLTEVSLLLVLIVTAWTMGNQKTVLEKIICKLAERKN